MRVISVQKNGNAIVSTRGLRRIVDYPGGYVSMEFVPADEAAEIVKLHNNCFPDGSHWCKALRYSQPIKQHIKKRRAKIAS